LVVCHLQNRKAHPDEKGTESPQVCFFEVGASQIARLIPMKRELKAMVIVPLLDIELPIARLIPMKRELKDMEQARAASLIQ
jgi:hypothetical protein